MSTSYTVHVTADGVRLEGTLALPERARGAVLFAHGTGSGRLSAPNRALAAALNRQGFATLLLDLLTREEEIAEAHLRFDVMTLATRLAAATDWLGTGPAAGLRLGYFGAGTGAAAALVAAVARRDVVRAVVSRGGQPDLAGPALGLVRAPTLFIVGGRDRALVEINQRARAEMRSEVWLETVPGATDLLEAPGALETVARLAGSWFQVHIAQREAAA